MKLSKQILTLTLIAFGFVLAVLLVSPAVSAIELEEPPSYTVAGVIGASYENGQATSNHPLSPNGWYLGGHYKTWVDFMGSDRDKKYHWLNYARGGEVSVNGLNQLNDLLMHTVWPDANGIPRIRLEVLVIGNWGNDYAWLPGYNPLVIDALVQNVLAQVALAKSVGVEKVIVTGWPEYEDLDLGHFISLFPPGSLPGTIDEAGYNQSRDHFYNALSQPNPDYVFVEAWCGFKTFDGVHPGEGTSKRTAKKISKALKQYDKLIGKKSLLCH
ncbi:MAG: hypothetical protein GY940_40270 [bacterium]|nr:hypothetical protein [bacterium]